MNSRNGFQAITVKKDGLLAILETNRDNHRAAFEEAIAGYCAETIKLFEERITQIKRGRSISMHFSIPEPRDQTADYDRVILMLEMDTENMVELTEDQFANYVQDNWGWSREFSTTCSNYLKGS